MGTRSNSKRCGRRIIARAPGGYVPESYARSVRSLVRPAEPEDVPAIAQLYLEVAGEVVEREPSFRHLPDPGAVERRYASRITDRERCVLVAVVDDAVAGFADASLARHAEDGTYHAPGLDVHVEELIVTASRRRRGVGTSLMRAVEQWATNAGARIVMLETHVTNEAGLALYASIGYREVAVMLVKDI